MDRLYVGLIETIIILGLVIMAALTFSSTAFRVFGYGGIYWAEEVTRYVSIWVVFLAAGLGIRFGIHLNIDLLLSLLSKRAESRAMAFCFVLMLVFELVLVWYGTMLTISNHAQQSASLRMPMSFAYAAIPVGAAIMCYETVRMIVRKLRGEPRKAMLVSGD